MKSKGKKEKAVINKDEDSENWCFVCKDGGPLRICDNKECLKSYHADCVAKDDSFLESDDLWTCSWHTCYKCRKHSYLHCYTCTEAVCRRCLPGADLFRVKGQYGFCEYCLELALLIEDGKNLDSDEGKVDFTDKDTYEGLFIEYYYIIKKEEGFELGDLLAAKDKVKTAKKSKFSLEDDDDDDEEEDQISDYDGTEHAKKRRRKCVEKRSGRKKFGMRTPIKSNKNEFIGWGSRSLIDFLNSIGKCTDEKLSEHYVTSIVNEYIKENKLMDPQKMKMIICDEKLRSLFKKRRIHKNKVSELLETHFAENFDSSEEDEMEYDSEDENANIPDVCNRQRKLGMERKSSHEGLADDVHLSCFALVVVENVKLVYLRRSVLLEMLKQPESFEEKVVGCFVRVKSDPYDYHLRNSHQLMQVRGVGRVSIIQNKMEVTLLFSTMPKEISTNVLSDDDFSEEECEHLAQKVLAGQLERPTVEDLQHKANIVHADLTKHWIKKELALLQNLIDLANEKGWRRELSEYREKKRKLETPSEVLKLLETFPKVIPDLHEPNPHFEDIINDMACEKNSPKPILQCNSSITNEGWQDNKASEVKTHHCNASPPERTQLIYAGPNSDNATSSKQSQPTDLKNDKLGEELEMCSKETPHELATRSKLSQPGAVLKNNKLGGEELKMCSNETPHELATRTSHEASGTVVIDLLSDDEDSNEGKAASVVHENQNIDEASERTQLIYAGPNSDNATDSKQSQPSADLKNNQLGGEELEMCSKETPHELASRSKLSQPGAELKNNKLGGDELEMCCNETPHELATRSSHKASGTVVIELLSDDEDSNEGKAASVVRENQNIDDSIWCVQGPNGEHKTYKFSLLRRFSETSVHASKFKVWREDEDEENAVWLHEAISIAFPKN